MTTEELKLAVADWKRDQAPEAKYIAVVVHRGQEVPDEVIVVQPRESGELKESIQS